MAEKLADTQALESTTVGIYRTASVVKGGRRFSFAALVVVGDRQGNVGIGYGKAPGVPAAIEKAQKDARKQLFHVFLNGGTLPHPVTGRFGASKVRLLPAAPGTGVIASGTVRAVLEMAGVRDCLTKAYGSTNKKNVCKAVIEGLQGLQTREQVADRRGVELDATEVDQKVEAAQKFMAETGGGEPAQTPGAARKGGQEGGGAAQTVRKDKSKTKGEQAESGQAQPPSDQTEPAAQPQAASAPSAPENTDQSKPAPGDVDSPKEQVSGDAVVEQPEPPTEPQKAEGETEPKAGGEPGEQQQAEGEGETEQQS